jgi:hypothetical protein
MVASILLSVLDASTDLGHAGRSSRFPDLKSASYRGLKIPTYRRVKMIRYNVVGALLGVLALIAMVASSVIAPAEARGPHSRCNIDWPCEVFGSKEINLRAN